MINWKQLTQSLLGATAAQLYTAPVLTTTAIHQATAWNPTTAAVSVKLFIVPIAGTAADATTVWSTSVGAGASAQISQVIGHKLPAGTQLYASGAGVTLTVSGAESV